MTDRPFGGGPDVVSGAAPGYYPDPSIPGFVRYWGGSGWVPGTTRPAPAVGEVLEPPRFAARAAAAGVRPVGVRPVVGPAVGGQSVVVDGPSDSDGDTGPFFFDQTSGGASFVMAEQPGEVEVRSRGDLAARGASSTRDSWLHPVRELPTAAAGAGSAAEEGVAVDPAAPVERMSVPVAEPLAGQAVEPLAGPVSGAGSPVVSASAWRADPAAQRGLLETGDAPRWVSWGATPQAGPAAEAAAPAPAPGLGVDARSAPATGPAGSKPAAVPAPRAGRDVPAELPIPALAVPSAPAVSSAPAGPAERAGSAGSAEPIALPTAGLVRRLAARLLDTVVVALVGVAAGVPLAAAAIRHVHEKLEQARMAASLTGREVQVWLVDGEVAGRIGALLGVLLLLGLLYEVLPAARTGQTFGKRVFGIRVVRVGGAAGQRVVPPALGRSAVRWIVWLVAVILLVGMVWPLFDRRGRRGWHDRAAGTRVVRD